jgi:glycosyltransferase involved in cell wall biosynthesis
MFFLTKLIISSLLVNLKFKAPYILFVGVMLDSKEGISLLIRSFNMIKDDYPHFNLYLVGGRNRDTESHLKLIGFLGLTERVFWMNEYHRDAIPELMCNAELLVLPRPNSRQSQGGFPTKLGEYLATGKPVCATKVGELPCYLTDELNVFFAEPDSEISFANAMSRALMDMNKAKTVGENGRKVAHESFSASSQAKILYEFLSNLNE